MWLPAWIPQIEGNVILMFFVYGLAFFTLGVVTLHEWRQERFSASPVGRSLHLLAAFAFLQAVVEWLEMFHIVHDHGLDILWGNWLPPARLILLALSGLVLGSFGCRLIESARPSMRPIARVPFLLFAIWSAGLATALAQKWALTQPDLILTEIWARYLLYLPGSLLSAWGLAIQPPASPLEESRGGNDYFPVDVVFMLNAFFGGVVVPPGPFLPADIVNSETFGAAFLVPVQVVRGATALAISYNLIRILHRFEVSRWRRTEQVSSRLRTLSAQIITAQEEERKRVARDLHDDTAQALTALLLRLRTLENVNLPERDRQAVEELRQLTARTFENVRHLASELRPPDLDDLGLVSTLQFHADKYSSHYGIRVSLDTEGLCRRLPAPMELVTYRIVQESLTNAVRHGAASRVKIVLEQDGTLFRVVVTDNGGGFDVDAVMSDKQRGLGLFGMQERAHLIGGTFRVESGTGQGAMVVMEAPLPEPGVGTGRSQYQPLHAAHSP